jgi:hypothetical protein
MFRLICQCVIVIKGLIDLRTIYKQQCMKQIELIEGKTL